MLSFEAQKREIKGRKAKVLLEKGLLPAVVYGPKIKNMNLELSVKDFEKTFREAGESSLIALKVGRETLKVLVHDIQRDPVSGRFIHVDFYQPILTEEIEAKVPLVFEGTAPAIKDLGGTLMKNISEISVKALPEDLPHELKVDLSNLRTFEDHILVKDISAGPKVKILRPEDEIVAQVLPPEKVEEELEKPIEEKIEEVEVVEKKEKPAEEPEEISETKQAKS